MTSLEEFPDVGKIRKTHVSHKGRRYGAARAARPQAGGLAIQTVINIAPPTPIPTYTNHGGTLGSGPFTGAFGARTRLGAGDFAICLTRSGIGGPPLHWLSY